MVVESYAPVVNVILCNTHIHYMYVYALSCTSVCLCMVNNDFTFVFQMLIFGGHLGIRRP